MANIRPKNILPSADDLFPVRLTFTLKIEAAEPFETLVPIYQTTLRQITDDNSLHSHCQFVGCGSEDDDYD